MTNSKMKPDSLKLLSLNVRGLVNFKKRRAIFTWSRKQKPDLIFLVVVETHTCTTKNCESQWKKRMGFFYYVCFLMGAQMQEVSLY